MDKLDERAKDNNVPLPDEEDDDVESGDDGEEVKETDEEVKQPADGAAGGKKAGAGGKKGGKQAAGGPVGSNLFDAVGGEGRRQPAAAAGRRGQ